MRELQEIEIAKPAEEPPLRQVQPLASIEPEVFVPSGQIGLREDALRKTREALKKDYPSDVSLPDRIQYRVAELGVRFLTSKLFVPNYTDGKGGDDHTEKSHVHRFTPRNTGGPSSVNSALHSASLLLKVPLEYIKRRWGA